LVGFSQNPASYGRSVHAQRYVWEESGPRQPEAKAAAASIARTRKSRIVTSPPDRNSVDPHHTIYPKTAIPETGNARS
jgi:hypothetical protein